MNAWKRTFVSAFIAQALSILGFSFSLPFLPFFLTELGVVDSGEQAFWAGVVLSSAGLTFALSAPFWGILADRYGRKVMVCRAMFGGTLVLLLMSLVQSVGQLVICRLLQGIFTGTMAASVALVASVVPHKHSGFTLGMMQAAVFIGNAIGPFFGGIMADTFGYRASFRMGALLCFLGGVLVFFGTHENWSPPDAKAGREEDRFRDIFLLKGFALAIVILFGVRLSNTMINPSFPLIVKDIRPTADNINSLAGSIMAAAAVAGAVSAATLGLIGDRFGHHRVLLGCCLGGSLASLGHFWAVSISHLVMARICFGLAVAGMLPAANAMIHCIIDHRSLGKAYGLATSLSMLGIALGPFTGGLLARLAGLRMPFLLTALAQLLLGVLVFVSGRKRVEPRP